jgi:L-seryl-tRNA(Ser) seleniumtransferase
MLHAPKADVTARADALAGTLRTRGWQASVIDGESAIGGGSAPGVTVPTSLVRLAWPGWSADRLETWLRARPTPIIARIQDDSVVLDLRTVAEGYDAELAALLTSPAA